MPWEPFEIETGDGVCQVGVTSAGLVSLSICVDGRSTLDPHGQMSFPPDQAEAVGGAMMRAAHACRLLSGEVKVIKDPYSERQAE